jgi:putative addiction module component (TIGR02574 family)
MLTLLLLREFIQKKFNRYTEVDMGLNEIENEILKLRLKDRVALARWLLRSLDDLSDEEAQALWIEEAERRVDEMEDGRVSEVPAEEVFRRARNIISA